MPAPAPSLSVELLPSSVPPPADARVPPGSASAPPARPTASAAAVPPKAPRPKPQPKPRPHIAEPATPQADRPIETAGETSGEKPTSLLAPSTSSTAIAGADAGDDARTSASERVIDPGPDGGRGEAGPSLPAGSSSSDAALPAGSTPPGAVPVDAAPPAPRYGRPLLEPARSGRLRYDLYYDDYTRGTSLAQVTLSFEVDGDGAYRMWTEGHAVGLTAWFYSGSLTQESRGRVTQDGLSPLAYDEKRGSRPARHVEVDPLRAAVVLPDQRTVPAEPGMQDRLSTLMQLSLFARTQPERFEPGRAVSIPELSFGGVEPVAYRSLGYVTLPTPLGPLNAIHLRRERPGKPDEPAIEIWLGYDQAMLPIRVRVADRGGRVLDQLLKELP